MGAFGRLKTTMILLVLAALLSPTLVISSANAIDSIPLEAKFSNIYRPDLASPNTCSTGSIQVWRKDNQEFSMGDDIVANIYAYYPEDKKRSQAWITLSTFDINQDVFTEQMPKKVGGSYNLCVKDWQSREFRSNFSALYIEIVYTMNFGTTQAGRFTATLPILKKDAEAQAIEDVSKDCPFNNFTHNFVSEVRPQTFKPGSMITLSGTYFYQGIPVPNHQITLFKGNQGNPKRGKVHILGTSVTDAEGVYTFKFKFQIPKGDVVQDYTLFADRRLDQIGFIHGPIDAAFTFLDIFCEKGKCAYKVGFSEDDFIPEFPQECLNSFKAFDEVFGASAAASNAVDFNFSDDRNLIAWIGRKVFNGSKNKISFRTIYDAEVVDFQERDARNFGKNGKVNLKGRCWVNGYTTRTGKRVSGYFRSCG